MISSVVADSLPHQSCSSIFMLSSQTAAAAGSFNDIHTGAKLFYSFSVSYHSFIVFYTVDSVMASNAKLLLSSRVKLHEKTNSLKPVFLLLCHDFLESRVC